MKRLSVFYCIPAFFLCFSIFSQNYKKKDVTIKNNYFLVSQELKRAVDNINENRAIEIIKILSSDKFEGRDAGKKGGYKTSKYLRKEIKKGYSLPLYKSYFQTFQAGYNVLSKGKKRYYFHTDSIAKFKSNKSLQQFKLKNIVAVVEGELKEEFIIIGAHYDHLGMGENDASDNIYNGADDNATGVSAVLQILNAYKNSKLKPKRTLIFAFWDGEEKGLVGSSYFVTNFKNTSQIKGYINFDMIGRDGDDNNNKEGVTIFYTKANDKFEQWLKKDIAEYDFKIKPSYNAWENPNAGSDNASFAKVKTPIIWYHTGGHADYHKVSDSNEKINYKKCTAITKSAFLISWKIANENF